MLKAYFYKKVILQHNALILKYFILKNYKNQKFFEKSLKKIFDFGHF